MASSARSELLYSLPKGSQSLLILNSTLPLFAGHLWRTYRTVFTLQKVSMPSVFILQLLCEESFIISFLFYAYREPVRGLPTGEYLQHLVSLLHAVLIV